MSNFSSALYKSRSLKTLTAIGAVFALAGVANAQATDAGSTVSNTFTLDYSVNDTPQPQIDNEDNPTEFTVDRLIDLTVVQTNSPQNVAPATQILLDAGGDLAVDPDNQPAVLTYTVTNSGNDNQAYSFSLDSPTGDFAATDFRIFYQDDAGNFVELAEVAPGTAGTTEVTEDIPAGESRTIFVLANIPDTAENNQFDDIILTAETRDPVNWVVEGATGTAGQVTASNNADNNDLVGDAQNVFADGAGDTDAVLDGLFSDTGTFIIASPNLTGVKSVAVIATDGSSVSCGDFSVAPITSPTQFSTSGACVEYVITVTNNGAQDAGGNELPAADTLATGIDVVDILPPELIFQSAIARSFTVAPAPDASPAAGTVCDGSATTCRVAFLDGSLDANPAVPGEVVIRAIVQ